MMAVRSAAQKAAQRKAALASARKRRGRGRKSRVKNAVRAQRNFTKTKYKARAKRTVAAGRNELRFYKGAALRTASVLTGAKPKSAANRHLASKGVTKRFVHGVKTNNAQYKATVGRARKRRNAAVRRAVKRR
jgi:hypothetical protein